MPYPNNLFIKTSFDRCTGCGLCQLACSFQFLGGYNPGRSLLRIESARENLYHFPVVCSQCENAFCANVCPVKAISRDGRTGALIIDPETCVACGLCSEWCPIHMTHIDPDLKTAVKCDLCQGDPACVRACPTGALTIGYTTEDRKRPDTSKEPADE